MCKAKEIPVKENNKYFSKEQNTNIMTSNGQLIDKFSFDLFNKTDSYVPVIFINPNSDGVSNGIEINNDIEKKSVNVDYLQVLLKNPMGNKQTGNVLKFEKRKKTRLLVKRGVENISLLQVDIALIYTKDKLVYVIGHDAKKYLIDKTLTELEQELDHAIFFRANRQYIVNLNFIKSFKAYEKVKLLLNVNVNELEEPVIISQEVAPVFKKWINNA